MGGLEPFAKRQRLEAEKLESLYSKSKRHQWNAELDVDWGDFDLVMVSSTWDYHRKLERFRDWLAAVDAKTKLRNPRETIEWNLDKRYLRDLTELGIPVDPIKLGVLLPVGISFFTFQAISYVVDVYRRDTAPAPLLDFAVYLSFFPQLVAGPIVRASQPTTRPRPRDVRSDGCRAWSRSGW